MEQSLEKWWAERENECWWKLQWGWTRGNIIRYSVTPPCSIYSTPSATCTFLSLSLFKKRWKTEREEERQSDCTWKREAEKHEEGWRGTGLRVCGRSSSPRCAAHRAHCLVTHVVHSNREPELVCVCVLTCVFRVHAHTCCVSTACEEPGCERRVWNEALLCSLSLLKCHWRGCNANVVQTSISVRAHLRYKIMLFSLRDQCDISFRLRRLNGSS